MAPKFIIDNALISDMLNFSAKPSPSYRQAEDESMRGLESLFRPEVALTGTVQEYLDQKETPRTFEDELFDVTPLGYRYAPAMDVPIENIPVTEKVMQEIGSSFKGIVDAHSEGMKQIDEDFADDPLARNALKTLGYIGTGFNTAMTVGFSPFLLATGLVGDAYYNITGDESGAKRLFRDLNTFLIGKGGEAPMVFKLPSKKGVVEAIVEKDGSIRVGGKTYGLDMNLTRAQYIELVRRETFGSAGRETGNLNLAPLREDGLPSPTVSRTEIPKVETKEVTQAKINKTTNELSNIKPTQSILDLEDYQYGNVGTRGFTEEVAGEIYSAEGYEQYQKEIQDIVRKNLGNNFTVYRGTTTKELDMEAGEPITRAGVSVTFNPKEAEAFVSGQLSLPAKEGEPVLLKINASPEMVVMRGSDTGELVLDGYSLNKSNMEIIPISKKQNKFSVNKVIEEIQTKAKETPADPNAKDLTIENIDPKDVTDNSYNPAVLIPKFSVERKTGEKNINENKTAPVLTKNFDANTAYGFPGQWWDFKTNQSLNNKSFMSGSITVDPNTLMPSTQFNNEIKGNYDIKIAGRTKDPELDGTVVTVNKLAGTKFKILDAPNKDLIGKQLIDKQGVLAITRGNSARNKTAAGSGKFKITGTDHIYTIKFNSTTPIKLGAFPTVQDNPRLVGVTVDDVFVGDVAMTIQVGGSKGKIHPVYTEILTAPPGTYKKMEEAGFDPYKKENSIIEYQKYLESQKNKVAETKYHPLNEKFKKEIREVLSTDLLSPQYLAKLEKNSDISCGQCYAAAEALYYKWAKFNGFTPKYLTSKDFPEGLDKGDTHWFLQNNKTKEILDPTAEQFGNTPIPYEKGTGAGFLTKEPSLKKGKEVLNRLGTEKVVQTRSGMLVDFANQKGVEMEGSRLEDWLSQHEADIKWNYPERAALGNLKNTTGNDPRFMVGFETKDGNRGYVLGYGTDKNIAFVDWITNLGTKDMPKGEEPSALKPSELKELKNELQKHYGFRQFAGDRITGVRKENRDRQEYQRPTYPPKDLFAITPKPKSGVDLMLNPFAADIGKSGKIKVEDIARFFDERPTRDINDPKVFKEMVKEAVDEIYYQLQQEVTGEGWYDEGVSKAMKIAEKINPKFKNNPDLKDLILFATAIASSGVNVGLDFKVGLQVADIFADTGKIPLTNPYTGKGWTVRGSNLAKQLNLANNYIQKNGLPAFLEFLHNEEITGREIQNFRKEYGNLGPTKGVKMDIKYTGDRAFGPKIGEFLANLYGTADNNVVDLWNVRSMNRLIGDMFVRNKEGKVILNNKGEPIIKDGFPTITLKTKFDEFMQAVANIIGKSVRDTQAIRWYFEQGLYTKLGKKSVPKDYGTAAEEVLRAKQKNDSNTGVSQSKTSNTESKTPTKKAQGGSISIPQRRSLVNDGLVDINYIIGR